jgi:hypothetical protein
MVTLRSRSKDVRPVAARDETAVGTPGVRPFGSERTLLQALSSLAGAAGIALLLPFAILLLGLPIALAVRGLLEAFVWLVPGIR